MKTSYDSSGFTIVEVVTTMAVMALFLTFFFQLYITMEKQRIAVLRRTTASDIAYSNLHKFPSKPAGLTVCDSVKMDLIAYPNAPGLILGDETSSTYGFVPESSKGLGANVKQSVVAYAPRGCANFATMPVKLVSKVSYGVDGEEAVRASFVK